MALTQIDFSDNEEKTILFLSKKWKLNKPKTIRKIISLFRRYSQSLKGGKNE